MSIEGFNGEENYYPRPARNKHKGDVMERREWYQGNPESYINSHRLYREGRLVATTTTPEDAVQLVQSLNQHAALVRQRDLLLRALRDVRAKFFEHAQAGANVVKGELVSLDNEQHPWIPGVEAPRAIEIIDNALATVEQGGES